MVRPSGELLHQVPDPQDAFGIEPVDWLEAAGRKVPRLSRERLPVGTMSPVTEAIKL
jgi:hypothetical protein